MYVQWVSGGRGQVKNNEERKKGCTMRSCHVIPASILKSTTAFIQYIWGSEWDQIKISLLAADCHLMEKVLYRYTDILTTANWRTTT